MSDDWRPTHVVPPQGLPTWEVPDASRASDNSLAGGLEVQVLTENEGWANVLCSNAWSAWVDAAKLTPIPSTKENAFLDQLAKPGNGLLAAGVTLALGSALSYLAWPLLAIPGKAMKDVIPRGNCTSETPGSSGMYFCSVKAGFLTALGPLLTVVIAIVFRRPIAAQLQKLTRKLPRNSSTLLTPLVATAMFTMVHASVHDKTADQTGVVPQRMFPALIGLFTFGVARLAPAVSQRFSNRIDARDRFPVVLRVVVALAIPLGASYFLTNQERVSDTALKEQLIAVLTLFTSYAALVPRDGDFLGAGQRLMNTKLQRGVARAGKRP
jgi:hypothetical protein